MSARRENPLLFERNGAFNPGWLFYMLFASLGVIAAGVGLYLAATVPLAWPLGIAALSFIAFGMLSTAVMVISLARAKLIAPALVKSVEGIAKAGEFVEHEWAQGEPQAGVM